MQQEYLMAAVVCARDGKWDMLPNEYTTFQYTATIKMIQKELEVKNDIQFSILTFTSMMSHLLLNRNLLRPQC